MNLNQQRMASFYFEEDNKAYTLPIISSKCVYNKWSLYIIRIARGIPNNENILSTCWGVCFLDEKDSYTVIVPFKYSQIEDFVFDINPVDSDSTIYFFAKDKDVDACSLYCVRDYFDVECLIGYTEDIEIDRHHLLFIYDALGALAVVRKGEEEIAPRFQHIYPYWYSNDNEMQILYVVGNHKEEYGIILDKKLVLEPSDYVIWVNEGTDDIIILKDDVFYWGIYDNTMKQMQLTEAEIEQDEMIESSCSSFDTKRCQFI
jgi:hypothetical protein